MFPVIQKYFWEGKHFLKEALKKTAENYLRRDPLKVILFQCVEAFRLLRHKKQLNFVFKVSAE